MEFTPINTQEELDALIGSRLRRERESATKEISSQLTEANGKIADYEKQLKDYEKSVKESESKIKGYENDIQELRASVKSYETASVKTRIAHETGIPFEFADRLRGENEEDIRKDAERFSTYLKNESELPLRSSESEMVDTKQAALKKQLAALKGDD